MICFEAIPFWNSMRVKSEKLRMRFTYFFGKENRKVDDRDEAIKILMKITTTIQYEIVKRIKEESTYGFLLKIYYIFNEVHSLYLEEKELRSKLVEWNIDDPRVIDILVNNRNIMRNIIDACNIWIENCVLYQHDLDISRVSVEKEFIMDYDLMIDLFMYGFASQGISLLRLSKNIKCQKLYYGLDITPNEDIPAEVLKYHPYIYFNTAIIGNQNALVDIPLTCDANDTDFGKGFYKENNVQFLLFIAAIECFQKDQLREDDKSLTVIKKERFIELVEQYTNPKINGEAFYNSFVLTQDKIEQQLRKKEKIIWIMGANKERHELRPFIGLEDGNILISYGALEQAKQLWVSYFSNGGMCYTNSQKTDKLKKAMERRNKELSDKMLDEIRKILNKHYQPKIDFKEVKYQRIFGERSIDYGDFDIVYYCEETQELFLIESKYFSDSLNSSGMVTDYEKLFESDGYYERCRRRYDLVLDEPEKIKSFVDADNPISVHFLFLTSKPIELEFQDKDEIVSFISLNIFERYIEGKLISGEDGSIVRPVKVI